MATNAVAFLFSLALEATVAVPHLVDAVERSDVASSAGYGAGVIGVGAFAGKVFLGNVLACKRNLTQAHYNQKLNKIAEQNGL